jgi:short-subunit dehydrogenase
MDKKIAVVTGASRGVGQALAYHLARSGYFVILIARSESLLSAAVQQIEQEGGRASFYAIDVSDSFQVKNCIDNIIETHCQIDVFINNAAILKRGTTEMMDDEIDELLKINLNGAIYCAKYVASYMKIQRHGYIINVSSLGGKVAASFSGVYAASKFGLSGFSEALNKEMSLYDVNVTNLCPSMIATEMAHGRKFSLGQMIQLSDMIKTIDYLLSLSPNAIPVEILISCLPLIKITTASLLKIYLD